MVWHFGHADVNFGSWQAAECQNHISNTLQSIYPIHTFAAKKRIEVIPRNVSKATAIRRVLQYHQSRRRSTHPHSTTTQKLGEEAPLETPTLQSSFLFSAESEPQSIHFYDNPATMSDSSTGSHQSRDSQFDFALCIGDDRADEVMFEYFTRLEEEANKTQLPAPIDYSGKDVKTDHLILGSPKSEAVPLEQTEDEMTTSPISRSQKIPSPYTQRTTNIPKNIITCTVGSKGSSAKWFIASIGEVLDNLDHMLQSSFS